MESDSGQRPVGPIESDGASMKALLVVNLFSGGLLRGHPCKPYYESRDGVGYLLRALIQLDGSLRGQKMKAADPANR